jgi:hypothetical protein
VRPCSQPLTQYRSLIATQGIDASDCYPPGEAPPPAEASPLCQRANRCCLAWYRHRREDDDGVCQIMLSPPFDPIRESGCQSQIDLRRQLLTAFRGDSSACEDDPASSGVR